MSEAAVDHRPAEVAPTSGRLVALDVIRAVAVISMIIGHVANYSFLWRVSHFPYIVWDGAQLFMLVSGVVVGIVHRRNIERRGMGFVAGKLARRAGLLYLIQVALVSLALWLAAVYPNELSAQFDIPGADDLAHRVLLVLTLQANPIYVNFLSSYVIILLLAIPALWLMHTGRVRLLSLLLVVTYVAGLAFPGWFTLPHGSVGEGSFNNATWFALFGSGMIAGWYWRSNDIGDRLRQPRVLRATLALGILLLAVVIWDAMPPELPTWLTSTFGKIAMAPGRFLSSWVVFILLWWLVTRIESTRRGAELLAPVAVLGSRALDSVVILTFATILMQTVFAIPSSSRPAQPISVLVLAICWAWAYARRWWSARRVN